ncbi:hypothetical protein [Stenotrophomonas sp. PD6]|uniref:hypothetical protein n=1 Tax=Stenotrophomonas sp. PD6 TaxID=3368612 RepID=UPI003BA2DE43
MTKVTATKAAKTVGLELSPSDMYPPLSSPHADAFVFEIADGASATFDITLNGQVPQGPVPGITMSAGPGGGALLLDGSFIASYSGTWPARIEVRAWQNGAIVDSRTARLHDTRRMVVAGVKNAALRPNPAGIPVPGEDPFAVMAGAQFFDSAGVKLPDPEISWHLELPGNPEGVKADGQQILILPGAQPGEVEVLFQEASGLQSTVSLTLDPSIDT